MWLIKKALGETQWRECGMSLVSAGVKIQFGTGLYLISYCGVLPCLFVRIE